MPSPDNAKQAGRSALRTIKVRLATGLADALQRDPERLAGAVEMGLVSRSWLEHPGEAPVSEATPMEMMERYLERSVEQKPSMLTTIGLNAIQVLSWRGESSDTDGVTTTLAVAFTDLEGFTAWTAAEGDAAASQFLAEHHRVVGPVVRSRGGKVVKRLGDGLLLTFPTPEAAVLACLDLVDSQPEPLRLRAGIHLGEVVLTRDDLVGHVVNVAARVTESAKGGEVVTTSEVSDAVDDLPEVTFGKPRRRRFKGLTETVQVCRASRA